MAKLIDDGFRVQIDSAVEDAIFVHTPSGKMSTSLPGVKMDFTSWTLDKQARAEFSEQSV